jgi:hypothetical protein
LTVPDLFIGCFGIYAFAGLVVCRRQLTVLHMHLDWIDFSRTLSLAVEMPSLILNMRLATNTPGIVVFVRRVSLYLYARYRCVCVPEVRFVYLFIKFNEQHMNNKNR